MPIYHGKLGGLYKMTAPSTGTRIIETTNWNLTVTAGEAEIRKHASNWVSRLPGIKDWTATVEAITAPTANQTLFMQRLLANTFQTITVGFWHSTATVPRWQGVAIVRGITQSDPAADIQTMTMDLAGHGTLALKI